MLQRLSSNVSNLLGALENNGEAPLSARGMVRLLVRAALRQAVCWQRRLAGAREMKIRTALGGTNPDHWEIHIDPDGTSVLIVTEAWWGKHADKQRLALIKSAEPINQRVAEIMNEGFEES